MFLVGLLLGFILGMILISCISMSVINDYIEQNQKLINERIKLTQENSELREIRINVETRATKFARKIKQIEDITFEKGQGTIVDRFDKIKEVINDRQINQ